VRAILRCYRSYLFRRFYWLQWASYKLTRYWRTLNIGLLKLLRRYYRVRRRRKLRRQLCLNSLLVVWAAREMNRIIRGGCARIRTQLQRLLVNESAGRIQRMLRRHWDWLAYFNEMAEKYLADKLENPKFGFEREKKIHHKPTYAEAKKLKRVGQVPNAFVGAGQKWTLDGTPIYSEDKFPTGLSFRARDLDILVAYKCDQNAPLPPSPRVAGSAPKSRAQETDAEREQRINSKRPLALPARPKSLYK